MGDGWAWTVNPWVPSVADGCSDGRPPLGGPIRHVVSATGPEGSIPTTDGRSEAPGRRSPESGRDPSPAVASSTSTRGASPLTARRIINPARTLLLPRIGASPARNCQPAPRFGTTWPARRALTLLRGKHRLRGGKNRARGGCTYGSRAPRRSLRRLAPLAGSPMGRRGGGALLRHPSLENPAPPDCGARRPLLT